MAVAGDHSVLRRACRRTAVFGAAVLALGTGFVVPSRAEEGPLPGACEPHVHQVLQQQPGKLVTPGCVPTLLDGAGQIVGQAADTVLDPPETYPDLLPDVTFAHVTREFLGTDPETGENLSGPPMLAFDTWAINLGSVALDLLFDDPTVPTASTASQCVVWAGPVCRERRKVGGFAWHEPHTHFHYQDFAEYELRRLLPDGSTDNTAAGLVDISDKVSFCLMDTDGARDHALPVPTYTLFCNPFRQGISPGWADIYGPGLVDQWLSVDGLEDGRYVIVVSMNTTGALWETDYDNNVVEVVVELSNGLTEATIVDRRYPA